MTKREPVQANTIELDLETPSDRVEQLTRAASQLELLSKPFAPAALAKRVREILDKQPQRYPSPGDPT